MASANRAATGLRASRFTAPAGAEEHSLPPLPGRISITIFGSGGCALRACHRLPSGRAFGARGCARLLRRWKRFCAPHYDVCVAAAKRSAIYFDPEIHQALRLKAAATETSISDVVNEAVRQTLLEDASDLEEFEKRRGEPSLDFEEVLQRLRRSGKL